MGNLTARPVRLEDEADLDAFVEGNDVALVELHTSGCPKCQAMEPVLGNVARSTGVPVGTANPADDHAFVDRFVTSSVPALFLYKGGEQIARVAAGFLGGEEVVDFIAEHVPDAVDD
ncbi:thioredoxin family protein [Natrarchaeobaculum sulfurireducens]|uniref:Thiol-disulfide isomerase n=1 Tax=Natrarchaeobaculum sulfurireducens TaxID=2044521 RepID=A0A346PFS7_9EURY|nr:thioredoxin family protein [Natrarchaeobaculum sulfurireducens]AXR78372.1 Thiol-disulfide isomerase [Natrarchaeobaculum sulfurireducens]